jgi:hypothetical protein
MGAIWESDCGHFGRHVAPLEQLHFTMLDQKQLNLLNLLIVKSFLAMAKANSIMFQYELSTSN